MSPGGMETGGDDTAGELKDSGPLRAVGSTNLHKKLPYCKFRLRSALLSFFVQRTAVLAGNGPTGWSYFGTDEALRKGANEASVAVRVFIMFRFFVVELADQSSGETFFTLL